MNCYDVPEYWDLAFSEDTPMEADFVVSAAAKYCPFPLKTLYEPGCGGGRLVVELASRGLHVTATDSSQKALDYAAARLATLNLNADLHCCDMTEYTCPKQVDLAYCFVNTFRHLLTEEDAVCHLKSIAQSLRPGGLYLLGLHLFPPDADTEDSEQWRVTEDGTTVDMHLTVADCQRRTRQETLQFRMDVSQDDWPKPKVFESDYRMRLYESSHIESLLAKVPALKLIDVFDFWYDLEEPLELNDELGDTVLVLQKQEEAIIGDSAGSCRA